MKGDHIGEFEELVLLGVQALAEDAYGVPVQQLLERETTRRVSLGAVYAALDRLEAKGLLRSRMAAGTPTRGGRRRRAFLVTVAGRRAVAEMQRVRARLWSIAPRPAR